MSRRGIAVLLWGMFLLGFGALCGFAAAFERFPGDLWLTERLQEANASAFERAMDWAEDAGDFPWFLGPWLGGAALLFAASRRWEGLLLLAVMLGRPLNAGLKELVRRPRPSEELVYVRDDPTTFAFPSGHAAGVMILYGALFYFATIYVRPLWLRLAAQVMCLWVMVFTGLERVWMGVHWPSDVVGGYYLGGLLVAAVIAATRWLRPAAVTEAVAQRY